MRRIVSLCIVVATFAFAPAHREIPPYVAAGLPGYRPSTKGHPVKIRERAGGNVERVTAELQMVAESRAELGRLHESLEPLAESRRATGRSRPRRSGGRKRAG